MMSDVTIIDYGMGNLFSVKRAFEHCGASTAVTEAAEGIRTARRLLLPGVGAFGDCMESLRRKGLVGPIRDAVAAGIPLMGICLGMQVLFEEGDEFGVHAGLGLIPGRVVAIPTDGCRKIPHVGWAELVPRYSWEATAFSSLTAPVGAYFSHSYVAVPSEPSDVIAQIEYGGLELCAAVKRGNVVGCQFHPEKSGISGLGIIARFMETNPS
jgi:glutamine amidotransferase